MEVRQMLVQLRGEDMQPMEVRGDFPLTKGSLVEVHTFGLGRVVAIWPVKNDPEFTELVFIEGRAYGLHRKPPVPV